MTSVLQAPRGGIEPPTSWFRARYRVPTAITSKNVLDFGGVLSATALALHPRKRSAGSVALPTATASDQVRDAEDSRGCPRVRGGRVERPLPGSKPGSLPLADPRVIPVSRSESALRELNRAPPAGWSRQLGRLAPLPIGQLPRNPLTEGRFQQSPAY